MNIRESSLRATTRTSRDVGGAKNRPCSFTWHPFSLQFKELGNIVYQREGEDGQNVPDRTKNFKSQSYDEKETSDSLVSSPVVGDFEERVTDSDVAFYRHCHHSVDRTWVWFD